MIVCEDATVTKFEKKLELAGLYVVMEIIDSEGPEAVSWWHEQMTGREILQHLLADREKRRDRLGCFLFTLGAL